MSPATLLAGLALLGSFAPITQAARAAGCAAVVGHGAWTSVASPFGDPEVPTAFSNGRTYEAAPYSTVSGRFLADYAVDPDLPSRVLATDGVNIQRSVDGGCTWTKVYSVAEVDAGPTTVAATNHILDLHAAHTGLPAAKQVFYALATPSNASYGVNSSGSVARVAVSTDGGATWAAHPVAACSEGRLAFAPTRPATAYLDCYWTDGTNTLWATTDYGAHWTQRTPKLYAAPWPKAALAVSPVNPNEVWASGEAYVAQYTIGWWVLRSTDGGRSFVNTMTTHAHDSFYEIGLALRAGPGGRVVVLAWNSNVIGILQPSRPWRFLTPPTPQGQAGAIESASFGADTAHVFLVAGYGVAGGDDEYYVSPTCGEGQRALAVDLRTARWRQLSGPALEPAHTSTAWFHLQPVQTRGGIDYWVRESGYRQGDCLANEGTLTTGVRHSFLLHYRDAS